MPNSETWDMLQRYMGRDFCLQRKYAPYFASIVNFNSFKQYITNQRIKFSRQVNAQYKAHQLLYKWKHFVINSNIIHVFKAFIFTF